MWSLILKQGSQFISSRESIYLGVDVGTSSVKAGFVAGDGSGLLQASVEYPTFYGAVGQVEQDAWDWWNAVVKAIQTLAEQAPQYANQVCSIAVSCQAPTLFGINRFGQPVGRGLIWMDRRAESVCAQELREHQDYIHQYSLNRIDPYYMLSKLVWQKRYDPDAYAQTACYLQINSWIVYQLTGARLIDVSNANLTQLLNVSTLDWDTEIFHRLGLDLTKMPPVVPCAQIAGRIRPDMARMLGLPSDAVVAAGCVDGSAVPYGLGLQQEGDIFEMSGTSSGIGIICDAPRFHPKLSLMKHVKTDKWFLKGSTSCSGGALVWFRDQVEQSKEAERFPVYSALAEQSTPGANGVLFLPYLNGERAPLWDSKLRGVLLGFSSATEKKDILRAIMEGSAYALRTIFDEFPVDLRTKDVIWGTGGGYHSPIWSQIKSDVLEMPIQVTQMQFDAAVLGDAYIAMDAIGAARQQMTRLELQAYYAPDVLLAQTYQKQYHRFCRLYSATRDLFHDER